MCSFHNMAIKIIGWESFVHVCISLPTTKCARQCMPVYECTVSLYVCVCMPIHAIPVMSRHRAHRAPGLDSSSVAGLD